MDDKSYTIRVPKKWVRTAMIVVVTALIVAPLTAVAAHTFTDVPDSHTFHNDIDWLADANVTKGCNPAQGNTRFCPDDEVTRGQMAAFLKRLAENQVVDAATAVTAETANNALMLDGRTVGCGTGQTEFAGECWETTARGSITSVFDASENCGTDGGRLPEALELRRFGQISSITSPNNEITASVYHDAPGGTYRTFHVTSEGLSDHSTLDDGPYRCVFSIIETAATPASASGSDTVNEDGS